MTLEEYRLAQDGIQQKNEASGPWELHHYRFLNPFAKTAIGRLSAWSILILSCIWILITLGLVMGSQEAPAAPFVSFIAFAIFASPATLGILTSALILRKRTVLLSLNEQGTAQAAVNAETEELGFKRINEFREKLAQGDLAAFCQLLEEELANEELPLGIDFQIGFHSESEVSIVLNLPNRGIVPELQTSIRGTEIRHRERSKTEMLHEYEYICYSLVYRIIYESFRVLPPLTSVELLLAAEKLNRATGNEELYPVGSITFRREDFENLSLDKLDPITSFRTYGTPLSFTKGFEPTEITKLRKPFRQLISKEQVEHNTTNRDGA